MRRLAVTFLALTPSLAEAQTPRADRGGACAAHVDCKEGLRCQNNVCVDEEAFVEARNTSHPTLDESFTYVGLAIGASLPALYYQWGEALQAGIRFGYQTKSRVQLQVELSPATVLLNVAPAAIGAVDLTGTIGYGIPLGDMVSWIMRFGGGGGLLYGDSFSVGSTPGFGEVRVDVFGVGIRTSKHLYVEFNAPSFRILFFPGFGANFGLLWVTSVALNYAF